MTKTKKAAMTTPNASSDTTSCAPTTPSNTSDATKPGAPLTTAHQSDHDLPGAESDNTLCQFVFGCGDHIGAGIDHIRRSRARFAVVARCWESSLSPAVAPVLPKLRRVMRQLDRLEQTLTQHITPVHPCHACMGGGGQCDFCGGTGWLSGLLTLVQEELQQERDFMKHA
jgi:hypothetical protein